MELFQYVLRKLLAGIPLVLGVTLVSFALMVYFGPDRTYQLLGKNPTAEQIIEVRQQLGYDQSFLQRYAAYLAEIVRLDFGNSSSGEPVRALLAKTIPVSLILILPGFLLGHLLGIHAIAEGGPGGLFPRVVFREAIAAMIAEGALRPVFIDAPAVLKLLLALAVAQRSLEAQGALLAVPFRCHVTTP